MATVHNKKQRMNRDKNTRERRVGSRKTELNDYDTTESSLA
jgi:hypothetical protein